MRLSPDEVHLWVIDLQRTQADLLGLAHCLLPAERARADRFRLAVDCRRFVAARAALRMILSGYLGTAASELVFSYGDHGKPFLADPGPHSIRFNLAHSGRFVLVALASRWDVGVDVEQLPSEDTVNELSEMALSPPERELLEPLKGRARRRTFVNLWTRKEAYLKADGRGLTLPLQRIDVSRPRRRVALLDAEGARWRACPRWWVRSVAIGRSYAGAVAGAGTEWQLVRHAWGSPVPPPSPSEPHQND